MQGESYTNSKPGDLMKTRSYKWYFEFLPSPVQGAVNVPSTRISKIEIIRDIQICLWNGLTSKRDWQIIVRFGHNWPLSSIEHESQDGTPGLLRPGSETRFCFKTRPNMRQANHNTGTDRRNQSEQFNASPTGINHIQQNHRIFCFFIYIYNQKAG